MHRLNAAELINETFGVWIGFWAFGGGFGCGCGAFGTFGVATGCDRKVAETLMDATGRNGGVTEAVMAAVARGRCLNHFGGSGAMLAESELG